MSTPAIEPSDQLRYPIGPFAAPTTVTEAVLATARADIEALPARLRDSIAGLNNEQLNTRYRPGGWTVAQVVHHLADSHLNSYTRFKLALTEPNPTIKPYEEAAWAELIDARESDVGPSVSILEGLHARWTGVLKSLSSADFEKTFVHPEHPGGPKTLAWATLLYGWHSRHHLTQILRLRERESW